jgi:hypothetical protein
MTLAGNTVYPYGYGSGSIDTNFDHHQFSLENTFKYAMRLEGLTCPYCRQPFE